MSGSGASTAAEPALLGRYTLLRKLGEGGMGIVYVAYDGEIDRHVAIKLLRVESGVESPAAMRMLREAQALARLSHPNVVHVYDCGTVDDQVFVAMEYIEGATLQSWQQQPGRTRSWRQVLDLYIQACHGLAAAHAAGVVHRDFKPDNVLVGADGRVRIVDFGLAVFEPNDDLELPASEPGLATTRGSRSRGTRDLRITGAGVVIGTPAYMSPEQHLRVATDPRSDQFSFCVALYEALYGERPFPGERRRELRYNTLRGEVRAPPSGSKVPRWVRAVLLRGLSLAPDQRFADMPALVAALTQRRGVYRWRWVLTGAAVALAIGAVWMFRAQQGHTQDDVCGGAEGLLVNVWDPRRAAAVEAALMATGRTYARDSWPRVRDQLDLYARSWHDLHVEVCAATNVHRSQSQMLMDLRMTCLAERRDELRALVDVLADADAAVAERAVQAVAELRPLSRCTEVSVVGSSGRPLPVSPAVVATRELMAQARAEDQAGRPRRGLRLAQQAVAAAVRSDDVAMRAQALLHRGQLEASSGEYEASESSTAEAYWLAESAGDDRTRFEAALGLMEVVGVRRSRDHDSRQWARQAEAVWRRLGQPLVLEAALRASLGALHTRFGRYEDALTELRRAIALVDQPDDPRLAMYQRFLGNLHYRLGALDQAAQAYARAVALGEQSLGRDHPDIARSLGNLGEIYREHGQEVAAEAAFRRAIAIVEHAFGPDHPDLGPPYNGLGSLAYRRGDLAMAAEHFRRVRELLVRSYGPDHPDLGAVTNNLAEVLLHQGAVDEARQLAEQALVILERALGTEHDVLADTLSNLARAYTLQGAFVEAAEHFTRAIAVFERSHGPKFAALVKPLTGLGQLALARGRPAEGVAPLERALDLDGVHDPVSLAEVRLALAQALWDSKQDPTRAHGLVLRVRDEMARDVDNPAHRAQRLAAETWLGSHVL